MPRKVILSTIMLGFSLCAISQAGTRIAYIDMNYILENIGEYNQASIQLEQRAEKWKHDIQEKKSKIEQLRKNLSYEKILLTKELIEEREEEIKFYEQDLADYQTKRFGPNGDYEIQQSMLVKPVQDLVFDAIQKITNSKRYDIVIDRSEVSMVFALKRLDISDEVLSIIKRKVAKKEKVSKQEK